MGAFITAVFIVTFWAFDYSLLQVMDHSSPAGVVLAVLLSLFFSVLIGMIYLFLITTFSKNQLPVRRHPRSKAFSFLIRIGFLVFMGVLVSKPIEVHFLDSQLQAVISKNHALQPGHFFGYKLKMIATEKQYAWTWWFSLIFIAIYLTPVLVKISLPADEEYYTLKTAAERTLIDQEYFHFKKSYATLMEPYGNGITFYEPFEDSPYNTLRKKDARVFDQSNDDLIRMLT